MSRNTHIYKANTDIATIEAAIATLTEKGRDTMRAVGAGETSFFDNGITEDSGIWGDNLTGELGHKSSGVINRLAKVGLFRVSARTGDEPSNWYALTALGADVANYLAGNLEGAGIMSPDHNCVPTVDEPAEEPESAEEQAAVEFTAEPAEQPERHADATYAARGNYNTVWVPAALVLAEGFVGEVEGVEVWTEKVSAMLVNVHIAGPGAVYLLRKLESSIEDAQHALRTWQKTQDRDGQTDMQKYNANRSFLAGYLAACTGAKKLPVIAFAKDMDKATVLDAVKAGAAARKAIQAGRDARVEASV